jgi:transposase InsO family protein
VQSARCCAERVLRLAEAPDFGRLIRASFVASHGVYGAPRVFLDLREAGETCSKHRVARLMRENGLRALHGHRTRRLSINNLGY